MLRPMAGIRSTQLMAFLEAATAENVLPHLEDFLVAPLSSMAARPSKRIRSRLVNLSFALASPQEMRGDDRLQELRHKAEELLENIHLASLIVDDIQDDSSERRGGPALHREYGLPLALNAGNSLYFWELSKLQEFGLGLDQQLQLMKRTLNMFLEAHLGQACDVGNRLSHVPQMQVSALSLSTMKLKTGALGGYAMSLGAFLRNVPPDRVQALDQMGRRFGVALQMFDDVGPEPVSGFSERQLEDFRFQRLSWFLATAADRLDPVEYAKLVQALNSQTFASATVFELFHKNKIWLEAKLRAERYLAQALADFREHLSLEEQSSDAFRQLCELGNVLKDAYAKL